MLGALGVVLQWSVVQLISQAKRKKAHKDRNRIELLSSRKSHQTISQKIVKLHIN